VEEELKSNPQMQKELEQQLKVAMEAQNQAVKRFRDVIRDIPSGLPHPDGSQRILNASRDLREAHNLVIALLVELNSSLDGDGDGNKLP